MLYGSRKEIIKDENIKCDKCIHYYICRILNRIMNPIDLEFGLGWSNSVPYYIIKDHMYTLLANCCDRYKEEEEENNN